MFRRSPVTGLPGTGGIAGLVTGSTNTQSAGDVASTCYTGVATSVSRHVAQSAGQQTVVGSVVNVSRVAQPPVPGTGGIAGLLTSYTNTQFAGGVASTCYAGVATPVSRHVAQFAGEQTIVGSVDNVSHVAQPSVPRTVGIAGLLTGSTNSQYAGGVASTCYAGVATPVSRSGPSSLGDRL